MNKSRREFIKKGTLTVAGLSIASNSIFALGKSEEITGIQLYSVRNDMKKDPMDTLTKIAKMGYKYVEHANYVERKFYGWEPSEFNKILSDLGMKMPSGHTVLGKDHWSDSNKDFTDQWKYTVEDAANMGQEFVISPWLDESLRQNKDDLIKYMKVFNKCGELCAKSGMKFGYHNHDFEFSQKLDGTRVYDIILDNTDPDLVIQQLDIGNMVNGGANAEEVMKKYPGRFPSMHVKDEIESSGGREKYESTILGSGVVDVKAICDLGRKSGGTKHFIIEQEAYQGKTPMESVKIDLDRMKSWGY